jgi:hypothetical protein
VSVIGLVGWAAATGRVADQTASEGVIFRAAVEGTETRLVAAREVPRDTTDRAHAPAAAGVPRAWVPEVAGAVLVGVEAGAVADRSAPFA